MPRGRDSLLNVATPASRMPRNSLKILSKNIGSPPGFLAVRSLISCACESARALIFQFLDITEECYWAFPAIFLIPPSNHWLSVFKCSIWRWRGTITNNQPNAQLRSAPVAMFAMGAGSLGIGILQATEANTKNENKQTLDGYYICTRALLGFHIVEEVNMDYEPHSWFLSSRFQTTIAADQ